MEPTPQQRQEYEALRNRLDAEERTRRRAAEESAIRSAQYKAEQQTELAAMESLASVIAKKLSASRARRDAVCKWEGERIYHYRRTWYGKRKYAGSHIPLLKELEGWLVLTLPYDKKSTDYDDYIVRYVFVLFMDGTYGIYRYTTKQYANNEKTPVTLDGTKEVTLAELLKNRSCYAYGSYLVEGVPEVKLEPRLTEPISWSQLKECLYLLAAKHKISL